MKETIPVKIGHLRQIIFWASVGIANSRGGAYERTVEDIVEHYAREISFKPQMKPKFNRPYSLAKKPKF